MARTGRPPKPIEEHVRNGTVRPARHNRAEVVVALPMAVGIPDPPAEFGLEARALWTSAWDAAITWLSPKSDMRSVVDACLLADDLAIARRRYHATSDPADARAVIGLQKAMSEALSSLGFTPIARTRMGVAEVKRVSALEELAARRRG